jgi:hypothetical protein
LPSKLNRRIRFAHAAEYNDETIDAHSGGLEARVVVFCWSDKGWFFVAASVEAGGLHSSVS